MKAPNTLPCRRWLDRQWRRLPLVDASSGNISITRVIALMFAVVDAWIMLQTKQVEVNNLWLALASLAAAFGKSTFSFLLDRMRYLGQASQVDVDVEVREQREIIDRRNRDQGLEATP